MVVKPSSRIDCNISGDLETSLLEWVEKGTHWLVIDFSNVKYVYSADLRVILIAAKQIKQVQDALDNTIHEVFEISGFLTLLTVTENRSKAISMVE